MPRFVHYERPFREDQGFSPLISGNWARNYYRFGYLACAREVLQRLANGEGENGSAMPALFLVRHYIEIGLKDILAQAGAFAIDLSDRMFGHNLAAIWLEAQKVFDNYGIEDRADIDDLIQELVELDQHADAFRYATNRKNAQHFERLGAVDLHALAEALNTVADSFEALLARMHREEIEMDQAIRDAVERDPW